MIKPLMLLAALSVFMSIPSCAHVQPVVTDIESCAGPELKPIAMDVAKAAGDILLCGVVTGGELPACALAGLGTLETALGPNGKAFIDCMIPLLERDMTQPAQVREGARAYRMMRARQGVKIGGAP